MHVTKISSQNIYIKVSCRRRTEKHDIKISFDIVLTTSDGIASQSGKGQLEVCVVVEESWPLASISSELAYHLQHYAFDYLDAPVYRVTQTDTPFAFSPTLIDAAIPGVDKIIKGIKSCVNRLYLCSCLYDPF